jgi:hypothetical protein
VLDSESSSAAHGGVGRSESGRERGDDGGAGRKGGESLEGKGLGVVSGRGLPERSESMASGLATGVFYSGSADRGGLPFGVSAGDGLDMGSSPFGVSSSSGSDGGGLRGDEANRGGLKAGTSDRAALAGSGLVRGQFIGGDRHGRDVDESTLRREHSESGALQAGMHDQEGSDRSVGVSDRSVGVSDRSVGVADRSVGVADGGGEVLREGTNSCQRAATHLLEPASPVTGGSSQSSRETPVSSQSSRETPVSSQRSRVTPVSSKSSRVTPVSNGRPAGSQPAPSGILGFLQGLFSPVSAGKKGSDFTPRTRATEVGARLEDDEVEMLEGRNLHSSCPDEGKPTRTTITFPC